MSEENMDPEIEWVNPHNAIETGVRSGIETEQQGYVRTLPDGEAIRFQWFGRPEEALESAGVEG